MQKACGLQTSRLRCIRWCLSSLNKHQNRLCRAQESSGTWSSRASYSGDVTYKHKGSWYTPPGPKLPEGSEIDYLPPAEAIGYVISAEANFMRVRVTESTVEGPDIPRDELLCVVRKLLKKMKRVVLVGDRVRVARVDWVDGRGMINEVLPRRSELLDPGVANMDHIMVLVAFAEPHFDDYQVTRFLLAAEATGVPVTLVVNKSDLLEEEECDQLISRVTDWGYKPIPLSVEEGTGIKDISRSLQNRWSVVVGPSGVGKSSLINYLRNRGRRRWSQYLPIKKSEVTSIDSQHWNEHSYSKKCAEAENIPEDNDEEELGSASEADYIDEWEEAVYGTGREDNGAQLKMQTVQSVSGIGRGKHTTRAISFLDLPLGGLLADTPGFNLADLSSIRLQELPSLFPEIESRLIGNKCRFRDCSHINEPGCMVRGDWDRYPLYCRFFREIRDWEFHEQKVLQSGKKLREGDVKVKHGKGGEEKEEAKLDSKKHRLKSRRSRVQKLYDMVNEEVWDDFDEDIDE